jgi:transposase
VPERETANGDRFVEWLRNRLLPKLRRGDVLVMDNLRAHLERALYRALHEIKRLQATRLGASMAPRALAVGTTTGPRVAGPESP